MHFLRLAVLSTVALLTIGGCQKIPGSDSRAEAEKIQALSNRWTAAIAARDMEMVIGIYAPDAVQLQGGSDAIVGRDDIKKWYQSWVNDPALAYTSKTVTIDVSASGDLAYERGTYSFGQTTPRGPVKEIGKYVTIWKKLSGEWKAIVDTGTPDKYAQP